MKHSFDFLLSSYDLTLSSCIMKKIVVSLPQRSSYFQGHLKMMNNSLMNTCPPCHPPMILVGQLSPQDISGQALLNKECLRDLFSSVSVPELLEHSFLSNQQLCHGDWNVTKKVICSKDTFFCTSNGTRSFSLPLIHSDYLRRKILLSTQRQSGMAGPQSSDNNTV